MAKVRAYSTSTLKKLFALSGNKCAFLNCSHHLVNEQGSFVGDIAHIEGLNPDGARYNASNLTPNEVGNLMSMCPTHHREIDNKDNLSKYPASLLKQWKAEHEDQYIFDTYRVSDELINNIYNKYDSIKNSDNRTYNNNNNTGRGSQFNNQAPIGTQNIDQSKHYYGEKNLNQSIHDDEIIREIFDFVNENISVKPMENKVKPFTQLKVKISLNFPKSKEQRITDMIINTQQRRNLVAKYLQDLSGIDDDKPQLLQEKIQSNFCRILNVDSRDVIINDINVFEELSLQIIPENKRNDSTYLGNAKAVVLHFFDICKIGKMTDDEVNNQLSLF
jgi:hypothetical protein